MFSHSLGQFSTTSVHVYIDPFLSSFQSLSRSNPYSHNPFLNAFFPSNLTCKGGLVQEAHISLSNYCIFKIKNKLTSIIG